jgi:plasmid stability protein
MPAIIVRNLSEATHRALRIRAARHGRSTEAEVRSILDEAVHPITSVKLGSMLSAIGAKFGRTALNFDRDRTPPDPGSFE